MRVKRIYSLILIIGVKYGFQNFIKNSDCLYKSELIFGYTFRDLLIHTL